MQIPKPLVALLETNAGGLNDLTTTVGIQFDESTPNAQGVRYIEVAGDASKGAHTLFQLEIRIGHAEI